MTVWTITHPVARKAHQCEMCRRAIEPGETYLRGKGIGFPLDAPHAWAECAHCEAFRILADIEGHDDGYDADSYRDMDPRDDDEAAWLDSFMHQWRDVTGKLVAVPGREDA